MALRVIENRLVIKRDENPPGGDNPWDLLFSSSIYFSIFMHSDLNPAWHFLFSTRFPWCLKMKSVENILGYIRGQFTDFQEAGIYELIVQENTLKCSKPTSFWGKKKIRMSGVIMLLCNRMSCCFFGWFFLQWIEAKIWRNYSVVQI